MVISVRAINECFKTQNGLMCTDILDTKNIYFIESKMSRHKLNMILYFNTHIYQLIKIFEGSGASATQTNSNHYGFHNLFELKFIVMPILEGGHYSMVIIANPVAYMASSMFISQYYFYYYMLYYYFLTLIRKPQSMSRV